MGAPPIDWVAWTGAVTGVTSFGWTAWREVAGRREAAQGRLTVEAKRFHGGPFVTPADMVLLRYLPRGPATQGVATVRLITPAGPFITSLTVFDAVGEMNVIPIAPTFDAEFHLSLQHNTQTPVIVGGFVVDNAALVLIGFRFSIRESGSDRAVLSGRRTVRALF